MGEKKDKKKSEQKFDKAEKPLKPWPISIEKPAKQKPSKKNGKKK